MTEQQQQYIPSISYFEIPDDITQAQDDEMTMIPGEFGMLLPILDVPNAYAVNPKPSSSDECIMTHGYGYSSSEAMTAQFTNSNSSASRSNWTNDHEEEKLNEEEEMHHHYLRSSSSSNERISLLQLQHDHGPLYEDDEEDYAIMCVGVKRSTKRYYAVGKTSRDLLWNDADVLSTSTACDSLSYWGRRCPPETVEDIKKLCPNVKRVKPSKRIDPITLLEETSDEETDAGEGEEEVNGENQHYTQLSNVQFLQAQFIFDHGAVTSTIVEKPEEKELYQQRFGKGLYIYKKYKYRLLFSIFCITGVLVGLVASGNLGNQDQESSVSKNIQNNVYTGTPTTFPSAQPSSTTARVLSAVAVRQTMLRANRSESLTDDEITNFEISMINSMTVNGTASSIISNPVVAARITTNCQVVDQFVDLVDDEDELRLRRLEHHDESSAIGVRRQLEDGDGIDASSYLLTLDYNITWSSSYGLWDETANMTSTVDQYLSNMTSGSGMTDILNSSGVENDGVTIESVLEIPQSTWQPTEGK